MTSRVELEIHGQQRQLAELFANARNNPAWMEDVQRIEPISGEPGQFGSVYKLVPKGDGDGEFVATVIMRALPGEVRLLLDSPHVAVQITDNFVATSNDTTKVISEEDFVFKGFFQKIVGVLAQLSIRRAHRRHMEAFKRFAEQPVYQSA